MFSFYVFCSLGSTYLAGLYDFHTTYRFVGVTLFCFGYIPAAILHLALEFPVPLFKHQRSRWIGAIYAVVTLFAAAYMATFYLSLTYWPLAEKAQVFILWLSFLIWILVSRYKWVKSTDPIVQRQCKWIFGSAIASFGLITTLWVMSLVFDFSYGLIQLIPIMILFPATVAFSIMHFNLFIVEKLNTQVDKARIVLEKTQGELAHSQRLSSLGTLAAGTAHEIGNAMNLVLGNLPVLNRYIKTLTHPAESSPDQTAHVLQDLPSLLKDIDQGASRAYAIVDGLKSFSKSATQSPTHNLQTVSVLQVFQDISHLCKPLLKTGQRISVSVSPNNLEMRLPLDQIQQVLINLIFNARDASKEHAVIELIASEQPSTITWVVKDHGQGISPHVLPHIFDPFFTTKESGTGLGLSVCYGIIRDLGGTMTASSHPQQGTQIVISFNKPRKVTGHAN